MAGGSLCPTAVGIVDIVDIVVEGLLFVSLVCLCGVLNNTDCFVWACLSTGPKRKGGVLSKLLQ